ncbi:hypothetical protein HanRHA438_Chr10g0472201 [Helianthus annuus]|nr:hypothetical protein HanRHA438_Chr10g0472201 [Helianthus annuus]
MKLPSCPCFGPHLRFKVFVGSEIVTVKTIASVNLSKQKPTYSHVVKQLT